MLCHTHSSHLSLGFPTFLLPSGLVLNIFLIVLFSLARIICPAHWSLFTFINPIVYIAHGYTSSSIFHFLPLVQRYISGSSFQIYLTVFVIRQSQWIRCLRCGRSWPDQILWCRVWNLYRKGPSMLVQVNLNTFSISVTELSGQIDVPADISTVEKFQIGYGIQPLTVSLMLSVVTAILFLGNRCLFFLSTTFYIRSSLAAF
jgi:hypothetical protein